MFSHLCPWQVHKCVLKPQNRAWFSETIDLRGDMARFTLKSTFVHLSLNKPHKCVMKPSEQGLFFGDDWFEWSYAQVYSKYECFPFYLFGNPINVCWNPQNRACFSETINFMGDMSRFTLKVNIFPSMSFQAHTCVMKPSEQGLFFQDDWFEEWHV